MTLVSELNPSRQMSFNTLHLLSMNPILSRSYVPYLKKNNQIVQVEQCARFMLDNQIEDSLIDRMTNLQT